MDTTGKQLRALRTRMGLTQAEVSNRLAAVGVHYSPTRISRLERGWIAPPPGLIECLAEVLDVPIAEFAPSASWLLPSTAEPEMAMLDPSEVAWIIGRLPPAYRGDLLSRLKATGPFADIAAAYGA